MKPGSLEEKVERDVELVEAAYGPAPDELRHHLNALALYYGFDPATGKFYR